MKRILTVLTYLLLINSLGAVNKYSINDILYVIDQKVNFRAEPNLNSQVIDTLKIGSVVTTLQAKYDKTGDIALNQVKKQWESAVTGKWTKVQYADRIGYIFDAYLSHYDFKEIDSSKLCISHDTIDVQDYETYTRTLYPNGVIKESGVGMEWGLEMYLIPDFSLEEAIMFIKPHMIDYTYGQQNWQIDNGKVQLKESDGVSSRKLVIVKYGEYVIVKHTGPSSGYAGPRSSTRPNPI